MKYNSIQILLFFINWDKWVLKFNILHIIERAYNKIIKHSYSYLVERISLIEQISFL